MTLRARKYLVIGLAALGLAAIALLFFFDPSQRRIYPMCQFNRMTGWQCPGCGGLRATHQLLHGNISAAMQLNAMVVISVPMLAAIGLWFAKRKACGEPPMKFRALWLWLYVGAWLVFALLRELPGIRSV